MPAEDVARLGKDVRGRSQVTGHDRKAVKLLMTFCVCMQTDDVYDRTECEHEIFRPLFGKVSEEGGRRSAGDRKTLSTKDSLRLNRSLWLRAGAKRARL